MKLSDGFELLATARDGVARLRELILSLAVRGNLTSRNVFEELPCQLLQQIRSEREQLIETGRIKVGRAPLPVANDEKPFDLPPGWQWARLGSLSLHITDGTHHTPKYLPTGVPFISVKDIDGRTVSFEDCKFISQEEHELINRRCNPERGDVLICRIGTLGRPTLVDTDTPFSVFVSVGLVKLPKCADISAYLHLALRSPVLAAQYEQIKAGGSHTQKLNLGDIPQLLIPLPPLEEQAHIVAKVGELMRLCDELETHGRLEGEQRARLTTALFDALAASESSHALAENWTRVAAHFDLLLDRPEAVDAFEQTMLQLAVRGQLVPQDPKDEPASELVNRVVAEKERLIAQGKAKRDKQLADITDAEKPFALPNGWKWVRFGDVAQITSGVALGRKTPLKNPVSLPYLRVANVQRWHLALSEVKNVIIDKTEIDRFRLSRHDLLITEGGDWDKVGRTCIWRDEIELCVHQNHIFKARGIHRDWNPEWAELFLNSADARAYFSSSAKRTTNLASINMSELKGCVFPVPPLAEQVRIVERVDGLRQRCSALRERLIARQTCQAHFAEALVKQAAASAGSQECEHGLAAAA
ncbi:restriction endonuclease subunit S [Burkholderia pyrrocinia]|uniref:restriction endonuclease subunit S n=1 Tax=Burkholderia pyrrocinia TaxID=60550 RepID=UPI001576D710|nr:restriction endonuclease subunit S [Burkholderia pyrrocinia]NTX31234.1 restriction endonuclease subunit S [Burkholderia pyrrocinia]